MVVRDAGGERTWRPDIGLLDGLTVAALAIDRSGSVIYSNGAAQALFGQPAAMLRHADVRAVLLEEPDRGGFDEVLRRVSSGAAWTGDLPMVSAGGRQTMTTSWSPAYADGAVVGALVLVEPVTGADARVRTLTNRLRRLAAVTTELLVAESVDEVTKIVTERMADAAGATVGSLSLLVDDETLALVGVRGGREGVASRWATYPVAANTPAGEAVRTRQTLVLRGREEIHRRFPELESAAEGERSLVCLPLRVGGRPIGVMSLSFPGRRHFDTAELEFFWLLADSSAQAIDRLQALAEAADQQAKLRFLASASAELSANLDYEVTLQQVAQLAVPWFADWCAIALEQDGLLRTVAVAHADPDKVALAWDLNRRFPPDPGAAQGSYAVLRSGQSELMPEVPDQLLTAAAVDEEHLRILRGLNFRSAMQVPLKARNQVFGVVTWVTGEDGRRFSDADLAFGEDLGRRAAVAIDNAQLHTELRQVAVRLQRAVLPDELPTLPGWEVAVRYLPAGRTDASGDFYEVVPLQDGRLVAFVGDVMGRGVQATSAMAQMRAAVRTLVAVDPEPQAVLNGLDRLFERFALEQLVTLVYLVFDPDRERVEVANAGHPAPLILRPTGDPEPLATTQTMLFGAGGGRRSLLTQQFGVGDTVLAFTDGLVERRGEDIDRGTDRLGFACRALRGEPLAVGLVRLVDAVRDPRSDDDVAILAIRRALPVSGADPQAQG